MKNMLVCTVLPTYNERDNIMPLIERLLASVRAPYMILVVDDDSPDRTWRLVEDLARRYNERDHPPRVALIRRTDESGLTSAIQRGIDEAIESFNADIVTWMDCDLSMPPETLPQLVAAIEADAADVAIGSRWVAGGADAAHGAMARGLSWLINHFAMWLLGRAVHDYTSGFVAARAAVLRQIRLQGDYGEYCIDFLARAVHLGFRVREIPYVCVPRVHGQSKTGLNLWDYLVKGRKYVAAIWRLRRQGVHRIQQR